MGVYMGVCMSCQGITDDEIEELSKDEGALYKFVEGPVLNASAVEIHRIFGGSEATVQNDSPHLDLENSWHGLHYLLTGSAWQGEEPLCYLLYQNRKIGVVKGSYIMAITSGQLAAFEAALQPIDKDELLRRYYGKAMAKAYIYLDKLWGRDDDDGRNYVCKNLVLLKEFLKAAKDRCEGMIVWCRR